jgi:hypothetical protein
MAKTSFKEWIMASDGGPLFMSTVAVSAGLYIPISIGVLMGNPMKTPDLWVMAMPFILFLTGMFMKQRNPKLWWSVFYGTVITADTPKLANREIAGESPEDIRKEIAEWVASCSKAGYIKINPYRYKFRRKGDAAMFKLAWG